MKKIYLSIMTALIVLTINAQNTSAQKNQEVFFKKGLQTWNEFKKTSPFLLDDNSLNR